MTTGEIKHRTDTLTRWLALWQTDESLRPEELHWDPLNSNFFIVDKSGRYFWEGRGLPTAALIRDAAVRWLMEHDWEKLDDVIRVEPYDLDYALYEAVRAVLEEDHPA